MAFILMSSIFSDSFISSYDIVNRIFLFEIYISQLMVVFFSFQDHKLLSSFIGSQEMSEMISTAKNERLECCLVPKMLMEQPISLGQSGRCLS